MAEVNWPTDAPASLSGFQTDWFAVQAASPCKSVTLFSTRSARTLAAVGFSLAVALSLAGCAILSPNAAARFHGTAQASVVLECNSPDYIFMMKPSCREEGFLRQIRPLELAGVLDEMHAPRELAVVSLVWRLDGETLQAALSEWKHLLKQCGFRQVVFVRSTGRTSVEGAVIIEVSNLT